MSDRAHITSIEALESFHAGLIVYREKACTVLDEASAAIERFKNWVKHEQKVHWQREVRLRGRAFEESRQEWFSSQLQDQRTGGPKELAYRRARQSLREAEAKLSVVRRWSLTCDTRIDPLARQLERMYNLLTGDLPRSIAYLAQVVNTLGDYAGLPPPGQPPPPPAPATDAGTEPPPPAREPPHEP